MYELKIPNNLESIIEVKIIKIYKKIGDKISVDDIFCEIETDKVSIEITSPVAGIIDSININENDTVNKDHTLAFINTKISNKQITSKKDINKKESNNKISNFKLDSNLNNINKSFNNPQNNIYQNDVFFLNSSPKINLQDILQTLADANIQEPPSNSDIKKLSTLKQTSIKNLKASQLITASTTTYNDVVLDSLILYRENNNKISFNAFFLKAISIALLKFPILNSQLYKNSIYICKNHNLAIAIATDYGLVAPTIYDVANKNILQIDQEIKDLADKANNKLLTLNHFVDSTFTLTNGGVYGSMMSTPIINYPQAAILGLHKIQKKPIVITKNNKDVIEIASTMYVALSYDHRIVDGKDAVSFLSLVKSIIENPKDYFKKI